MDERVVSSDVVRMRTTSLDTETSVAFQKLVVFFALEKKIFGVLRINDFSGFGKVFHVYLHA
jgi:hypothetical protein